MKILIADDEPLVRVGLSSMLQNIEENWDDIYEASNGEELLKVIATSRPSIAIVDIKMPKINGLDAIHAAKTLSPSTKFIILSGYSDFEYAKQALQLGVSGYLMKPVDPIELERALESINRDNQETLLIKNQQFQYHLHTLCHGLASIKYENPDSIMHHGSFIGWTFIFDTKQWDEQTVNLQHQFYERLHNSFIHYLHDGLNLALVVLPSGELCAIGAWAASETEIAHQHVTNFFRQVEHTVREFSSSHLKITVLKSNKCIGFESLYTQLQQLQHWIVLRAICGINTSYHYLELERHANTTNQLAAAKLMCNIVHQYQDWKYLNFQHTINELESFMKTTDIFTSSKFIQASSFFLRSTIGINLPEPGTGNEIIAILRKHGEQTMLEKSKKEITQPDLVDQVLQYVENHYMDEITIGYIAKQLNVSSNYLSSLFHKKTGQTFVKHLTRIRMLKAKELLNSSKMHIKQVANQVGYYSTRHFTKLFIQTFGIYPSDVRKDNAM